MRRMLNFPAQRAARALLVAAVVLLAACRPDTVRISFTPAAGTVYRYEVRVRALTESTLADSASREPPEEDFVMHAEHRVVAVGPRDTDVEIKLDIPGAGQRTFTATFDRGAELSQIRSIEGVPAEALGRVGLSEILPGATGAPPRRPLGPGDRWKINAPADLTGGPGSRLRGEGRLVALGVISGRDVATLETQYTLPVRRTTVSGDTTIDLDGIQTTIVKTVRALADGAVESADAVTHARYRVTLTPAAGQRGAPVTGRLTVEVRSTTLRQR